MTQKTIEKLLTDIHTKLDYIIEMLRDDTLRYPGHETYLDSMNEDNPEFESNPNK
jgi:hypothetical protein